MMLMTSVVVLYEIASDDDAAAIVARIARVGCRQNCLGFKVFSFFGFVVVRLRLLL